MKVGDLVGLYSYDGLRKVVKIIDKEVPDTFLGTQNCYITDEGALFYMKAELGTGKHCNVGNKAFWIKKYENIS